MGRLLVALFAGALPFAAAAAPPAPGRYDAELCVTTGPNATPSCGAAEVDVRSAKRVDVRVSDIVYQLALRSSQLDVATRQGTMQIDEFSSDYEWLDGALRFRDDDKGVTYVVRPGARRKTER